MKEPAKVDEEEDDLEDFADEVIEQTVNVLGKAEEEVAQLEKEVKEMAVSKDDMVRVSVTNMSPGVETDEKTGEQAAASEAPATANQPTGVADPQLRTASTSQRQQWQGQDHPPPASFRDSRQ